jgi:predicted nucleic acid-binding protein
MAEKLSVIYWDSTALLSYLIRDSHSDQAQARAKQKGVHLLTTLAIAEVYTVLSRIQREKVLPDLVVESLFEMLESGPWSRLNIVPDSMAMRKIACRWPLRGSRLWHLATAKTLQREFPELVILTYDRELARASEGESLEVCK